MKCIDMFAEMLSWLFATEASHPRNGVTGKRQGGIAHLVVADPDAVVRHREADNMIEEGLAAGVTLGRRKGLRQHLLHQLQVRLLVKRLRHI